MGRYRQRITGPLGQLHQELLLLDTSQAPAQNQQESEERTSL